MTSSPKRILETPCLSRRRFLCGCVSIGGMLVTSPLLAALSGGESRSLAFRHTHTGERKRVTYWRDGEYLRENLQILDHLLRDHRTGESTSMDRALLDMLYGLQQGIGGEGEFEIISAYRSPKTNQMLRTKSGGVAKRSLHMQGRAIDVRLCGCDLKTLRDQALAMKAGGVGYYPKSNFIHIDTGRFRSWS
ncbi:MAG: DUF882 domain-containing protein [gamma proteobacterium symbiont of Ctena orbiculata]|nr:DUF882 domain-containing protein [Candidatus Thiodiazotropha taylori]MBT3057296.1 DUF882 domain-containing protein [Candidatus Thiodiazotropha sp. (ex Lucina pensylvanica)]MBT3061162.1 DUF882 domain-containing protein [Candidatus Thiodiazotropha sp. (ex Lucina pensylvanica)]PUB73426.1 MAG: hypothetical protein DBP03_12710 [gamma proteobacterium symbiont of Ctena orbiculata]PUB77759.1 MAG: hypothetical protein DBO99_10305 [gamma proteobacterium symbiont of Ctena orbiculata]